MKRNRIIQIIVAAASALFLLAVSYLYNNNPYPFVDDIEHYAWLEYLNQQVVGPQAEEDSVVCINVAYDKCLIPYRDAYGMPVGNIDITDRDKLTSLLQLLNREAAYRYIFLDVRFEKGYNDLSLSKANASSAQTVDAALFAEILRTPRIVVATHDGMELDAEMIHPKLALSDYMSTITATNFVRYQYVKDGEHSVPMRIYHDLTGHDIRRVGCLYLDDGSLCYNCPFLRIPHAFYHNQADVPYMNLGTDILDEQYGIGQDIVELTRGKYVFIGDYVNDTHDTYVGMQPGSYITQVAMDSLFAGRHLVNWLSVCLVGILYFVIALVLCSRFSFTQRIPLLQRFDSKITRFLISLVSISVMIYCLADINYLLTGETFCVWIPSVYFTALKWIMHSLTYYTKR